MNSWMFRVRNTEVNYSEHDGPKNISIMVRVSCPIRSVGRASALYAEGPRYDSRNGHIFLSDCYTRNVNSIKTLFTNGILLKSFEGDIWFTVLMEVGSWP